MAKGGGSIVPVVLLSISLLGCGCNGFAPSDLPRHHCYQPLKPHTLSSATRTNGEEQLLSASSDTGATDSIESFANDIEKVLKGTRAEDLDYTVSGKRTQVSSHRRCHEKEHEQSLTLKKKHSVP